MKFGSRQNATRSSAGYVGGAAAFLLIALLGPALAGCDGSTKPAKPPAPPAPPPPTAEEILASIEDGLMPLEEYLAVAGKYLQVTPEFRDSLVEYLEKRKREHSGSVEGERALRMLTLELEEKAREAREAQRAPVVLLLCDLLEVLDPGASKLERYRRWAELEQKKPVIVIKGWYEPEDTPKETIFCFIEAFIPETGEVVNMRIREGEEFLGLKCLGIIGKKRGLELRYLATGDTFKVYTPLWEKYQKRQQEIISESFR